MDIETIRGISSRLLNAERTREPIDLITSEHPDLTEDDAYRIARTTTEDRGDPIVGFKLGFTSAAMRAQMGIDEPNFGYLTRGQAASSFVNIAPLIHPLIEPEIALVTGRDIHKQGQTRETVFGAIEAACAALEIVDTRFKAYKFKALDNISDNSSTARFILGPLQPRRVIADLRLAGALLWADGQMLDSGIGANALGDPLNALAWLANTLVKRGEKLPAGSVVLTGGLTRAYRLRGGQTVMSEIASLGAVHAHLSTC
jgi:2-keto-4-pentenoate hydratase